MGINILFQFLLGCYFYHKALPRRRREGLSIPFGMLLWSIILIVVRRLVLLSIPFGMLHPRHFPTEVVQ